MSPFEKQHLSERGKIVCAECGSSASPGASECETCGARDEAALRQAALSQGIYAGLHEGLPAREEADPVIWPVYHHVYYWIDPRDRRPIYVGITMDMASRRLSHMHSRESAVYCWMQEHGVRPKMIKMATYATREQARAMEEKLIAIWPGLVNRDVEITARRIMRDVA
jgi:predicted GIY-YIG superfamily endonuclease/ribosomal protein L40E